MKNNRLAPILNQYKELELVPDKLSPQEMGYIYQELRRYADEHVYFSTHRTPPLKAGVLSTLETCADDEIDRIELPRIHRQKAKVDGCYVFWDRRP